MSTLKILAISGSLKSTSSNTTILKVLSQLKSGNVAFSIFDGLEPIPAFNPEKEAGTDAVMYFKKQLQWADGVIISTPEYAFGVPGVLKNALDWTVSSGELNEKPVIAISASPLYGGGDKALASLVLTLGALGTNMTKDFSLSIPDIQNKIKNGEITDAPTLEKLKKIFDHLLATITPT